MGSQVGLIGLAVMGQNLALNIESRGFPIAVFNRTAKRTEDYMAGPAAGKQVTPTYSIQDFVKSIDRPRRIIIMVQAGPAVDEQIAALTPYLDEGDMVIDAGNSLFRDTERRAAAHEGSKVRFVGMGVSGGEEGALKGPSIMPGGSPESYKHLAPILEAISAKSSYGNCVSHIGPRGAGHYVKMVHNAIEYGDMQLIAETYDIMRHGLGLGAGEMSEIFGRWNGGDLSSYLIEVTRDTLSYVDKDTGKPLVDLILDKAGQKGTGRWTSINALELGTPIPTIDAAVWARTISSFKDARVSASSVLHGPKGATPSLDKAHLLAQLEKALYVAKVSSYAQGMALLLVASGEYDYGLNLAEIARIWTGGCIIRANLLGSIQEAFHANPGLSNLMLAPEFSGLVNERMSALREVVGVARQMGVPCPAMSAALDYFDSFRQAHLPQNLTQAQRDYFGAHTYERVDKPGIFHTEWGGTAR
ncbi:MAG: NADP-dependent phosphogluconate dehydrogenase [Chloroflexota bacterium]